LCMGRDPGQACCRLTARLQQGNEPALKDQVRQQFRMNMHEEDEVKVSSRRGSPWHARRRTLVLTPAQTSACQAPNAAPPPALHCRSGNTRKRE